MVTDQDSICAGIAFQIVSVQTPIGKAVVRILLMPKVAGISPVDVVPKRLLLTTAKIRSLSVISRIIPVLRKRHRFGNAHRIDKVATSVVLGTPSADNPVARLSGAADLGLTRRERARSIERVRREPIIACDHVGKQSHEFRKVYPQLNRVTSLGGTGLPSGFCQVSASPVIASTMLLPCHPTIASPYSFKASGISQPRSP